MTFVRRVPVALALCLALVAPALAQAPVEYRISFPVPEQQRFRRQWLASQQ